MARKPSRMPDLPHGEGSLSWDVARQQVRLQHKIGSHRYLERADTVADVLAKRDARQAEHGRPVVVAAGDMTVADALADWLPFASSGQAPSTLAGYRWAIRHVEESGLGAVRLAELRPSHIERLLLERVAAGNAKWSIVKLRTVLKMALDRAVRERDLPSNPLSVTPTPKGAKLAQRTPHFYADDAATMKAHLAAQHSTVNAALATILLCGLRPGEAIGLRWEHVRLDVAEPELDVRSALRRTEAGSPDRVVDELKTSHRSGRLEDDAARRTVPIPAALVRILKRERREQLARSGRSDYVFADARGRHLRTGALLDPARAAADATGLDYVPPNGYRHTFGSLLWNAGAPATEVAALMGHIDATMLMKTYGKRTTRRTDTTAYFGAMAR